MITFQTDSRRRATLPEPIPTNETFEVEVLGDGTFRLIPVALIPKHQLWAWRPEVQEAVDKTLAEYHEAKGVVLEHASKGIATWVARMEKGK